jgi:hypothetical protein
MFKRILIAIALIAGLHSPLNAQAVEDYSCLNFKLINERGLWSLSEGPQVTKAVVTWSIFDPGNCITKGLSGLKTWSVTWQGANYVRGYWDGVWSSEREGNNYVIILTFDIPNSWLVAVGNSPGIYSGEMTNIGFLSGAFLYSSQLIERKVSTTQTKSEFVTAYITTSSLWNLVLSNRQKIQRYECIPEQSKDTYYNVAATTKVKVIEAGAKPTISIEISDSTNCISLIHTPSIGKASSDKLINYPFWSVEGQKYWSDLVGSNSNLIRVSANAFGQAVKSNYFESFKFERDAIPVDSKDSVSLADNKITITSILDLSRLDRSSINTKSEAQIVIGAYAKYDAVSSCTSGGWRVNWTTSSTYTVRYSSGGCTASGLMNSYQVISTKIPLLDLLERNGVAEAEAKAKAALELKAKLEAEAKAALELKAKLEAEAKVAAELKVKQEADLEKCLKLTEISGDLKIQIEGYKSKFPGNSEFTRLISAIPPTLNCNDIFQSSAFSIQINRLETSLDFIGSEFAAAIKTANSSVKKITITCMKGKLTKKVTAVKPVCPTGYKKK